MENKQIYKNGQSVWVLNKTGDIDAGIIISIFEDEAEVKLTENGKLIESKITNLNLRSGFPNHDISDLVNLELLNEAEVLNTIRERFKRKMIYSNVGLTLLFVNPYQTIEEAFQLEFLERCCMFAVGKPITTLDPHIWTMTANAYKNVFLNEKKQALIVIGESGAGKTESTKLSLKLLTSLGCKKQNLAEKILSCSAVLESFGNAKTVRNDNSSRFGKYVTISLNRQKQLEGASMTSYLLEKSRIISHGDGERNYHIFYQILSSEPSEFLGKIYLRADFNYNYLGNTFISQPKDDMNHKELKEGLLTLGFSIEEVKNIMEVVASVLLIGQLDFDESTYDNDSPCQIIGVDWLEKISKLLKVDNSALEKAILNKTRNMAGTIIDSPIKKSECLINRDGLAKEIYDLLFKYLIKKLNLNLTPEFHDDKLTIGLLDIFGFEVFKENSFEQLCINFTNEKLSQLFIDYVFKSEAKSFKEEGLESYLKEISFKDNNDVIAILESPPAGIFLLIDEACQVAGDDLKLSGIIQGKHSTNKLLIPNRFFKDKFTILHSAKGVEYSMNGFRLKNRDEISSTLTDCLSNSKSSFIKQLFLVEDAKEIKEGGIAGSKKKFLASKFREQINILMKELNESECSFLRCIKPNEEKRKDFFDNKFALQQIRYLGVLDSIKIRKESFPVRFQYKSFYSRFFELEHSFRPPFYYPLNHDFKNQCRVILENYFPELLMNDKLLLGRSKIFTHQEIYSIMNERLREKLAYRSYYIKKRQKEILLKDYLKSEANKEFKYIEQLNKSFLEPLSDKATPKYYSFEYDPYDEKCGMTTALLDFEISPSHEICYKNRWDKSFLEQYQNSIVNRPSTISISETHTLMNSFNGKCFSFGLNESFQLGRSSNGINEVTLNEGVMCVCSGDSFSVILTNSGKLLSVGDNQKGELGLGDYKQRKYFTDINIQQSISYVTAKSHSTAYITNNKECFAWGLLFQSNIPKKIEIPIQIKFVALSYEFAMFLSISGLVYGIGKNLNGEIGNGSSLECKTPVLNETLKSLGHRISQIQCGLHHTIASTSLNKVYSWGRGVEGQLGLNEFKNEYIPKKISNLKAIQVMAGRYCSQILTENQKIMVFGNHGRLQRQATPVEYYVDGLDGWSIVRILTTWNKCECILYASIIEEKNNKNKIRNLAKQMTSSWVAKNIFTSTAPYCQSSEILLKNWMMEKFYKNNAKSVSIRVQEKENLRSKSPMQNNIGPSIDRKSLLKKEIENQRIDLEDEGTIVNNKILKSLYSDINKSRNPSPNSFIFEKNDNRIINSKPSPNFNGSRSKSKNNIRNPIKKSNILTFGFEDHENEREIKKSSNIMMSPRTIKKIKDKIDLLYSIDSKNWTIHDKKFIHDLGENTDILEIIQNYY